MPDNCIPGRPEIYPAAQPESDENASGIHKKGIETW
jgi:hypothetical protein